MLHISALELKSYLESKRQLTILDVRESYEYDICKINALHIPMADVEKRVSEIPKDQLVVVMCRTGKRAIAVANLLVTDFIFSNICVLEGGILAWIEQVDNHLEVY